MQANFVLDLGHKAQVPIISYSTADPSLNLRSSYFFQATQSEASQVKALSAIVRAFRWKEVVPIYAENVYGEGLIPFLTDALLEVDAIVPYRSVIPSFATDHQLVAELQKLMTMQTRVFIVHMDVSLGARIFKKANEIGMMSEGYVWMVTNVITSFLGSMESSVIDSMQGVIGTKTYVPESKALKRLQFQQDYNQSTTNNSFKLNVFGLWAYDAATALAMAVEDVWNSEGFVFNKATTHVLSSNSTDLETFGVSLNGPRLLKALSNIRFKGIAGEFSLVNGQLQSSTYQIVNVLGNGQRVVGFWTSQNGLKRNLSTIKTSMVYSTKKHDLGTIMWPGDSIRTPKGWEVSPKNSRKLRIGVPQRANFKEFVNVQYDPSTNRTIVGGYCIEVFEALVEDLPNSFAYEFIPFVGRYEELVYQVYIGTFDGAVGDISISANRSLYVDFTFPYSESGVSIVMPVKIRNNKNTWIFLKPWTWDLWAISACFFVFTGFVVWVLEHPINEDFQGPPSNQIGTSLWFSFSSLVFAHRERVVSNLARFVVVIWIFVVLILSQSYAASLTSFLTVQQLQPMDTNSILIELLQKGKNVGCQSTIICKLLTKQGFADSQIKVFKSVEVAYKLISHGDVAALLDETPYNNLFIAKYCSNFTLVGPIFRTDGFGFVSSLT
ncbi:Ionotropic glutamate receptor, metazoa [Parasponia andersonii]|uniref:Ionotropic glutamate receptor, metazoa n=1 Tax=Parasponia andersonii TaxID=3476 RepID=A0A2P5C5C9_PARAD|nr:Ionotropic glutamate receptor, metazoa [Parasponia andersonii]